MKVTVFGAGYVGLVQGAVLADSGNEVVCVDIDEKKVEQLNQGNIPIYEPGLSELIKSNHKQNRLRFTSDMREGVMHGMVLFIAVGTPPDQDGSADLQQVVSVATTVGRYIDDYKVIVNKSTVPVGTKDLVVQIIEKETNTRPPKINFDVVSNPEFLKEGAAIADCKRPDRIILGTESDRAISILRELYDPFNRNHEKIIVMDARSAELTKYAANSILATKISFMNEMAALAERMGADIEAVRKGIGSDPRIGYDFIYAGLGYGGSCFPKDVRALIAAGKDLGFRSEVLEAVERRNFKQKELMLEKICSRFGFDLKDRTFAIWGLAFKPNTNDMREAPSRPLMEGLLKLGARVRAYDPQAMDETRRIYAERVGLELVDSKEKALEGSDALILVTEWPAFRAPDFDIIKSSLKLPLIFDGRNLYDPKRMLSKGFEYISIGRMPAKE
ncbi:MAG: UDP-glucose/GDP-mannose dehydrogenase family protein [Pedobacter sp.]|nr:MAG: UDP-glucose/GDP-mannose dehydrogenase family protein [Pedobacter sp.]